MPFFKSRLFGQKVTVRLNPRYAEDTKRLIQMLAADDDDGKTHRAAIYEWLDTQNARCWRSSRLLSPFAD